MRIFIECTRTLKSNLHTGIQRVVRRYIDEGQRLAGKDVGLEILLVVFEGSGFHHLQNLPLHPLEKLMGEGDCFPDKQAHIGQARSAQPGTGDVLLLMDSSWYVEGIWSALRDAKANGCQLVFVCHDVIPLLRPDYFSDETVYCFKRYWAKVGVYADQVICVSDTTRRQLLSCWRDKLLPAPNDRLIRSVAYNYLGGNFCNGDLSTIRQSQWFPEVFIGQQPVFLCVGTIEIRKNHGLLLEAFERLWADKGSQQDCQVKLVLAGQYGWKARSVWERLQQHPVLNDKLFIYESLSDHQLNYLYHRASALVSASNMEGFGLPVAEALYHHLPVLVSDIPVYREITHQKPAELFANARELYALLKRYTLAGYRQPSTDLPANNHSCGWISWRDSFAGLLQVIQTSRTGADTYAERY